MSSYSHAKSSRSARTGLVSLIPSEAVRWVRFHGFYFERTDGNAC